MEDIRFSIIVPVYNTENYLKNCIDSILNQTYRNFELILVDDGSTDASGKICDEYAEKYNCIKVVHQNNLGPSAARNTGLDNAKFEWISFVDSDDWIEIDMLEILAKHIAEENADLYYFNANCHGENNELVKLFAYNTTKEIIEFTSEFCRFKYFYNIFMRYKAGWEVWQRTFRRDVIIENNLRFVPRDEVFAEDFLFSFQYLLCANKISALCNVLYNYRKRENSLMDQVDADVILPRLYNFAVAGYESAQKLGMKYFVEKYYKIYFLLLDNQIGYFWPDKSLKTIFKELKILNKNALHKQWSVRICLMILKNSGMLLNILKKRIRRKRANK